MGSFRPSHALVRFGSFELDRRSGELRRDGIRVRLQEQPLQILLLLLEQPGKIITREDLRQKIWPSDTFVDFDHGINNAIKRLREALGDSAETAGYIETLPRRGHRFIGKIEHDSSHSCSLAVLPLNNLSRDPDHEYFADGMTEALITTLAKIGQLRVVSRTSCMLYRGVRKPLKEIARELEVDTIIEGSVLRAGPRVRITAQLIDMQNEETNLWAESYERSLSDILALQADVAQAIAREVRVKLTPQEQAHLARVHPVDAEAYEAYLRGRFHWNKRSREGHAKAVQYFQQAIVKDPAYASAYAGLADAVSIMGLWGLVPPDQGCGKAKELALTALDLDHGLAEAHASLAWAKLHYEYDFADAEREFERAIETNSRCASAHHWFGMMLGIMGRYEEAYTELKRAIRLDPHWSLVHFGLGFVHWCGRRYEQAIEECHEALELDPNSPQAHVWLGLCYGAKLMWEPAIVALQKATELSQRAPVAVACLGEAYAVGGFREKAQSILHELTSRPHVTGYFVSRIHAALGAPEKCFEWLKTAYKLHGEWMVLLGIDPRFDVLRDDARFQALIQHMKFPAA